MINQVRTLVRAPEVLARTWRVVRQTTKDISETEVREALERLDPLWDELFPAEQTRIIKLLVERVDVSPEIVDIRLRAEGLASLAADLNALRPKREAA